MSKDINIFDNNVENDFENDLKNESSLEKLLQESTCNAMIVSTPMIKMNLLDAADIRSGYCPICKGMNPLKHIDGFLVCPRCGMNYKIFANDVYIIDFVPDEIKDMSINEIILHNMGMGRKANKTGLLKKPSLNNIEK